MRMLAFSGPHVDCEGRRVCASTFEERSTFPIAAGCLIANGVRETLSALFGAPVEIRLFEPVVPTVQGWRAITEGAQLSRITGTRSAAVLVLRAEACVGLASAAFGERTAAVRPLSSLEETVLARILRAIAPAVAAALGGRGEPALEPVVDLSGCTSYVELQLERPIGARIGIALGSDAPVEAAPSIGAEELLDVEIELRAVTDGLPVMAGELAALEVGTIVPITVTPGLTAHVMVAGRPIARGECGVRGNRLALAIGLSPCTEGSSEPGS